MKTCHFCAEQILPAAIKCRHCGEFMPVTPEAAEPRVAPAPEWNSGLAAAMSIIPGAGQLYSGRTGQGILWLLGVLLGYFVFAPIAVIAHAACIWNASGKRFPRPRHGIAIEIDWRSGAKLIAIIAGIAVVLNLGPGLYRDLRDDRPASATKAAETAAADEIVFATRAAADTWAEAKAPLDGLMKQRLAFRMAGGERMRFLDPTGGGFRRVMVLDGELRNRTVYK